MPGLIFRYSVYHGSLVKRPFFASNTIYSTIAVILYSVAILIVSYLMSRLIIYVAGYFWTVSFPFSIVEFNNRLYIFHEKRRYEIVNFVVNFPISTIIFFSSMCFVAFASAKCVQYTGKKYLFIGRLMYGPLAPIISRSATELITCFVLTKISHENRRLIYAGYPSEISLGEGNNIDHIIINNPEKFYLRLGRTHPSSSFKNSRSISTLTYSQSYIYISASQIENVHFEGFYFE